MNRSLYEGTQRRVAISIDVGETTMGASYCILLPGQLPEIQDIIHHIVEDYEGEETARKVPSVLWYNTSGEVTAVGAETTIEAEAEENQWVRIKWFKEYLQDKAGESTRALLPLPPSKAGVDIFADLLRHIFDNTKTFLESRYSMSVRSDTSKLWKGYTHDFHFILTHPHGYGASEHVMMRKAATIAGLVADEESAQSRVSFVSGGEASLRCCIERGLKIDVGKRVMIIDAGGETINFSSYSQQGDTFVETESPQSIFEASASITKRAKIYFEQFLKNRGAPLEKEVEAIAHSTSRFDTEIKSRFNKIENGYAVYFPFNCFRGLYLRSGHLHVSGVDIASFFQPVIDGILGIVKQEAISPITQPISAVFLVGGLSANRYLLRKLQEELSHLHSDVLHPEGHLDMTAANGAIAYYLDNVSKSEAKKDVSASEPVKLSPSRFSLTGLASGLPQVDDRILKEGPVPVEPW